MDVTALHVATIETRAYWYTGVRVGSTQVELLSAPNTICSRQA